MDTPTRATGSLGAGVGSGSPSGHFVPESCRQRTTRGWRLPGTSRFCSSRWGRMIRHYARKETSHRGRGRDRWLTERDRYVASL